MKKTHGKKSMVLGELTRYLDDLIKMGFVSEYLGEDGKQCHKLTNLGEKSGLKDFPN